MVMVMVMVTVTWVGVAIITDGAEGIIAAGDTTTDDLKLMILRSGCRFGGRSVKASGPDRAWPTPRSLGHALRVRSDYFIAS